MSWASKIAAGATYISDIGVDVGRHDLQTDGCNCNTHDRAHVMRLELEAYALNDDTNWNEYGSWDGGVQPAFGINITIVRFGVQIDKSVGYRTC